MTSMLVWDDTGWTPLPTDERKEALDTGMRLVWITEKELGGWEDAYCPEQVMRAEIGARAFTTLTQEWSILAGWRNRRVV